MFKVLRGGWLAMVCLSTISVGTTNAAESLLSPKDFQQMIKLDFDDFDQSLPEGGWGGIKAEFEAARVIDAYLIHHAATLSADQKRVLIWHAGHSYASYREAYRQ